jgi:hypothetical protein
MRDALDAAHRAFAWGGNGGNPPSRPGIQAGVALALSFDLVPA